MSALGARPTCLLIRTQAKITSNNKYFIENSRFTVSELNAINTQCAEQLFSWLKRYSAIISSLGWVKAPLYLLLLFHYKNLSTCQVRPNAHFDIVSS